ncbi:hypothetical protein SDC9_197201 [bioreactor metagenome]|uniref:Uncharacterized protein n=1 Tax=bioreactor metagenome TaxID=1076179 RepID=A0A645IGJ0_9ZZZZ
MTLGMTLGMNRAYGVGTLRACLLDVLHLFAHLLDQHLHVDADAGQLQRG